MSNLQPHIQLDDSLGVKYALLPGDPARLDRISPFLENVQELKFNREYRSLIGTYKGVNVLAISTGIGGASAGIAVEELHNIGVEAMIRIGSCGSLQPKVKMGDIILVSGAVRDDGASKTYVDSIFPAVPDANLLFACMETAKEKSIPYHTGVARSHDSFYTDEEDAIDAFWSKKGVLGCDMETAALFTIGHLRGVKTASILNNVVEYEGDTSDSIGNYVDGESLSMQGEKNEIYVALEAFVKMENGLC
ncbi:nucleoside phosphorylase [Anaerotignum sp.]|uniref:nucleoside phosphorylase n=1 Tax=Anaerotignum sp. TaxID=2039241 RepID=UPI0028AEBCD1|nr:nucleoside phosphorylase [Anaerotignum sp.]